MTVTRTIVLWLAWLLLTAVIGGYLAYRMLLADDSSVFLLGETTHGHHQIELACDACHTRPFGGADALQAACMDCHGEALSAVRDTHPRAKFTDPRNVDTLRHIDALSCITCHREHKPTMTGAMGVTVPMDFCIHCHQDIGAQRVSHEGMDFMTCAGAGCHNYHNNRALYEDFLLIHAGAASVLPDARVIMRALDRYTGDPAPSARAGHDAPAGVTVTDEILNQWAGSQHAERGVNCMDCHAGVAGAWLALPDFDTGCAGCHAEEIDGFLAGMHGMRRNVGLSPMRPGMARLPMREDAHERELGCMSCHGDHAFDTRRASVDACLGCHADNHSLAYVDSPHHVLWKRELAGDAEPGTGVSCATCHMPREEHRRRGDDIVVVQHNQNANLRPVEAMARTACMSCHGLAFTLDALADADLRANNFRGLPREHVPSIEMAEERLRRQQEARQR